MTTTLAQKHPIKGSRAFELVEDEIRYTIESAFKTESLSVVLSILDPEPVRSGRTLSFVSQVNREPLVELFLDEPDKETFDAFVGTMRRRITENDFGRLRVGSDGVAVRAERVRESIAMLRRYVDPREIDALLVTLEALATTPADIECLRRVADAFNALGFVQGQVLTYAPYIAFLLSGGSDKSDSGA